MLYKAIDGDLIKDVYKTGIRTEIADIANELLIVGWEYVYSNRQTNKDCAKKY